MSPFSRKKGGSVAAADTVGNIAGNRPVHHLDRVAQGDQGDEDRDRDQPGDEGVFHRRRALFAPAEGLDSVLHSEFLRKRTAGLSLLFKNV